MARLSDNTGGGETGHDTMRVSAEGHDNIALPDADYIANAEILRDGQDLVLRHPDGDAFIVEGYFADYPPPVLTAPGGAALTPELVQSFVKTAPESAHYAQAETVTDESPVGTAGEVAGAVTVTRADGTVETLVNGAPVFQGDIIETDAQGAVNIVFLDETSFAVSANAKLAIDEYVFDPATGAGETNFSVLRGMFVFVSGLIGREDPDDVKIETPVGSIGIRGTTIAGNVNTGEFTVVEGAIVLRSPDGRTEMTLAAQFETARFNPADGTIEPVGIMDPGTLAANFNAMQNVAPAFFSGLADTAPADANGTATGTDAGITDDTAPADADAALSPADTAPAEPAPPAAPPPGGYNETSFDGGAQTGFAANAGADTAAIDGIVSTASLTQNPITAALSPVSTATAGTGTTPAANTIANAPVTADSSVTLAPPPPPPSVINNNTSGGTVTAPSLIANNMDLNSAFGAINGLRISGLAGEHLGATLAALGDYNNDGRADFIAGNNPGGATGTARIYGAGGFLGTTRLITQPSASDLSGLGDIDGDGNMDYVVGSGLIAVGAGNIDIAAGNYTFMNVGSNYDLGSSVAGAGDINGDGYNDIIIGAPGAMGGNGKVVLVFGDDSMTNLMDFADNNSNGTPDFVDAGEGYVLTGGTGLSLGTDVSGAGDFNNDGFADVMFSQRIDGKAYIRYGDDVATGITATPTLITGITAGNDDIPMFHMGDMNGDGISDIGIADLDAAGGQGILHVIYGSNSTPTGINLSGGVTAGSGFSLHLPAGATTFTSGGPAGDFDGDGRSDVAVAIRNGDMIDIYILYGPALSGNVTLDGTFLSNTNNAFHMIYSLQGQGLANPATDLFDLEILSPGDMNGDGRDDLVIGAERANNGAGEIIVVYGRDSHGATISGPNATAASQSLVGTNNGELMSDNGYAATNFSAGAGNDTIRIATTGTIGTIDGGAGTDILMQAASRTLLDFSALGSEKISNIERFIMQGTGQTLRLGIDDIFTLMQQSDDNILRVDAPNGGVFQIDNMDRAGLTMPTLGFTQNGTAVENSITYDVFEFGAYRLYIDVTIAETVV